jgi:hypothetical protein
MRHILISETQITNRPRGQKLTVSIDSQQEKKIGLNPPCRIGLLPLTFFPLLFPSSKFRRPIMESALLQNSPFTITDDQFDPNAVDLLADAIISNSIERASKARRSTTGDDKRKFDQVDGTIKSANPLKTTRELCYPLSLNA